MTARTREVPDLSVLCELLGVADAEPRDLIRAARCQKWSLPQLVLSMLERDGIRLGSGGADELRRARIRKASYAELEEILRAELPVRTVKGSTIARWYPEGLLRPVGDLDLVTADEVDLWRAVGLVLAHRPVEHIDISVIDGNLRQVFVSLDWPAPDALFDNDMSVEIGTAALPGDSGAVGVRPRLPEHDVVASLLALAEERFQRDFEARDVVDLHFLAGADLPPVDEIAGLVDEYRLAPELMELVAHAERHVDLDRLGGLGTALSTPAEHERRRRSEWRTPSPAPGEDVAARLSAGMPVYGMQLRRVPWREDRVTAEIVETRGGHLLVTPVADYLLVGGAVVTTHQFDAALRELAAMDGARA